MTFPSGKNCQRQRKVKKQPVSDRFLHYGALDSFHEAFFIVIGGLMEESLNSLCSGWDGQETSML